jgi:purine nucleoside phosphorylase
MRRLGGDLVVDAGAAERIAALHQGLRGATLALVLDVAAQTPPADPGTLAAAAGELLPELAALVTEVVAELDAESAT